MKIFCILIVSLIPTIPLAVSADDSSKTYLSAGFSSMTNSALDVLKHSTGVTIDKRVTGPGALSDTVVNLSLGYKVSPSLAIEGGIITGGEISATLFADDGTLFGKVYQSIEHSSIKAKIDTSYLLGLKYSGEIGSLGINIKAGQLFWDVDYISDNGNLTYDGTTYNSSGDNGSKTFLEVDGSNPYAGLGISYAFSKNSSIDLGYFYSEMHEGDFKGLSLSWVRNL